MVSAMKQKFTDFLLGLFTLCIGGLASILWILNANAAANESRVNSLEKDIQVLRQENKSDHDKIIDILMRTK